MFTELRIKNFAVIENLEVSFREGMNVITGETGAGKSIIIEAAKMILGDRAAAGLIRSGEKEAVVEAQFDIEGGGMAMEKLDNLGIDSEGGIVIRRVISRDGKNRVFINGTLATLGMLTEITEGLISISSQHEHQILLKPERHLHLLDSYGRLDSKRENYRGVFMEYMEAKRELEKIQNSEMERSERIDLLSFQLDEITGTDIKPEEDEALTEERGILSNAERLADCASYGEEVIYSSEGSIVERLGEAISRIKEGASVDGALNDAAALLENILFQLEDTALTLREYKNRITVDPARLEVVEGRIAELERLKKKYGPCLDDVIKRGEEIASELEAVEGMEEKRNQTEEMLKLSREKAMNLARDLSGARKESAERLSRDMASELAELGMKGARFEVKFSSLADLGESGLDQAEFYLSTNPGEEPGPLAKVASGGELSRIMLLLKGLMLGEERAPSLIFDEVDAGIGGGAAEAVGMKLKGVSKSSQVLCITHLPQIASMADTHFIVSKRVERGRTCTSIERLGKTERMEEIARMLGGVEITEKTREHAREMLGMNA